jgi:hypothetical protein
MVTFPIGIEVFYGLTANTRSRNADKKAFWPNDHALSG